MNVLRNDLILGIVGMSLGVFFIGQDTGMSQTTDKKLTKISISQNQSEPGSGKQMYKDYCAVCHGMDGKGDGPAVQFLQAAPPDLTTMGKRYNERNVTLRVNTVLRFGTGRKARGTLDCPLWGDLFYELENRNGHPDIAKMRISNLSEYVQSMQAK
jgi:Cytochrome c